ncbi:FAD-dependent oxidoreductase [uncultured Desulfosarcina sp.]|uniref:FAD-dependent oxidoreductase n=1 Tax=uncultured Desulfosarcina sp. TaxID=218289 RepID=UPI0029C75916|nr:FAD-dependent oxidoreductase [uncultured Desulfosarcina sp.]
MAGLAAPESIVVPDKMLEGPGIHIIVEAVTCVDAAQKKVYLSDGRELDYDKLFLGMGAKSMIPPIEGIDLKGVLALRGLEDAEKIRTYMAEKNPRHLVFIGAGFISLEVASLFASLAHGGKPVTIVELMDRPLPLMLDADMAAPVADYLEEKGLTLLTGKKVSRIVGSNGTVTGVQLDSGETLDADMVFVNVGVRPNTELAESIGLEMGDFGIKVNAFQETSDPDILAGGDCVEKINFVTGKPEGGRLRGPAVMQGRLAAKRLAGYDIKFPGVLNAGGCQVFDLVVTATGLTETDARRHGIETVSAVVDSRSKHGMIPGMQPWKIKLVFERESQVLIGGQIVSHTVGPAREIDAVSAFILGKKTIGDLTTFTSACNPDISSEPSAEPITIAAEQALQKLKNSG